MPSAINLSDALFREYESRIIRGYLGTSQCGITANRGPTFSGPASVFNSPVAFFCVNWVNNRTWEARAVVSQQPQTLERPVARTRRHCHHWHIEKHENHYRISTFCNTSYVNWKTSAVTVSTVDNETVCRSLSETNLAYSQFCRTSGSLSDNIGSLSASVKVGRKIPQTTVTMGVSPSALRQNNGLGG